MQDGYGCGRRRGGQESRPFHHGKLDQPVSFRGRFGLWENGNQAKRQYSEGVKRRAVGEYLSGQGSSMAIAEKYQLCSENLVLDWVKAYHDRTSRQKTEGSVMRKDHAAEKRWQAVLACLDGGKSLGEIAQAYP